MRVKWLAEAGQDLIDNPRTYIAREHPETTQGIAQRILDTITYLRDYRGIGRTGRIAGTRELVSPGLPYIVPYRIKGNVIEILGVLHGAREWHGEF